MGSASTSQPFPFEYKPLLRDLPLCDGPLQGATNSLRNGRDTPQIGKPWCIIGTYYWVDDHPLLHRNNGSLDLTTCHCFTSPGISDLSRLLIKKAKTLEKKKKGGWGQTVCPPKISNENDDDDVLETHQV